MEDGFRQQITIAGFTVFGTTYILTQSIRDALIVTVAHGVAHWIAGAWQEKQNGMHIAH